MLVGVSDSTRLTSQLPISLRPCWHSSGSQPAIQIHWSEIFLFACTDLANKVDSDDDKFYKVGVSLTGLKS